MPAEDLPELSVGLSVSADGRPVAEAEVPDAAHATALVEAAARACANLVWAYSDADLSSVGFQPAYGYRRMTGMAAECRRAGIIAPVSGEVLPLTEHQESAELWAAVFTGQWGHKTAQTWPFDLPPDTRTLGLWRDGAVVGVCRLEPNTGLIDAPGLVPAHRNATDYLALLTAAISHVAAPSVSVESWGDDPERVRSCERLGLRTVEYLGGWQFAAE